MPYPHGLLLVLVRLPCPSPDSELALTRDYLRHSEARGEPQSDPGHCRVKFSLLLDMMKANPKYGQLLVKTFEKYKNIEYLNPHDEIKCIKNDMFHDIRVKVKRQDSTYQDVHLGDIFGS